MRSARRPVRGKSTSNLLCAIGNIDEVDGPVEEREGSLWLVVGNFMSGLVENETVSIVSNVQSGPGGSRVPQIASVIDAASENSSSHDRLPRTLE
jgi:hypothetical protein